MGAALYASAKQLWGPLTAPIDLEQLTEWAKDYEAPILDLPASVEVSWYPHTTTRRDDAPPPAPPYPGHVVMCDSRDAHSVELIQQALSSLGFDIAIDGDFGRKTQTAVKSFQKARGLDVDGKVGSSTWKALFGS